MADTSAATREGREKGARFYRYLAIFQFLVGSGLLVCGILGVVYTSGTDEVENDGFGPPYFIGGFIAGALILINSFISCYVQYKAPNYSESMSDVEKKELGCAMSGGQFLSMFTFMGCFIGLVMVGIGGICSSFTCYYSINIEENHKISIILLVLLLLGLGTVVASMCIVCTYGSYFGVMIRSYNRGRMNIVIRNQTAGTVGQTQMGTFGQPIYSSGGGGVNTDPMVSQLQRQNELLQQQIQLQQQQLQQQQQQSGMPQPPPAYGFATDTGMYPPTAPPPEYPGFDSK